MTMVACYTIICKTYPLTLWRKDEMLPSFPYKILSRQHENTCGMYIIIYSIMYGTLFATASLTSKSQCIH